MWLFDETASNSHPNQTSQGWQVFEKCVASEGLFLTKQWGQGLKQLNIVPVRNQGSWDLWTEAHPVCPLL